jgi:hypothetical protein
VGVEGVVTVRHTTSSASAKSRKKT